MARDVEVLSGRGRAVRGLLGGYAVLIYVFLFAPIVLLVLFSFNANRYGTFPITGWTLTWYRQAFSDYQVHGAVADDPEDRRAGDRPLDDRRNGRRVPARALAAAVPRGHPDHPDPADHDPRPADRRLAARPVHEHVALDRSRRGRR